MVMQWYLFNVNVIRSFFVLLRC